jgi:co-chaperonin GroES (HSP10)
MRKFRPIRQNFTVKIIKEKKTAGGIIMLDTSKEHMAKEEGIIIALGEDMFPDALSTNRPDVKLGDVVAFARYGGKHMDTDDQGNEIRALRDIDIICVIEEE